MRFEQNLAGKSLGVLILTTTQWARIERCVGEIAKIIPDIKAGTFVVVEIPFR
jgi:hypothetical protein